MKHPTQAVIFCGGLGTRLHPHTLSTPKPMIECNGRPFLWYLLDQVSEQGITKFLLLTGYLSEVIVDYFGDGGQFGWSIEYANGPTEWDTGRRFWEAKHLISKTFILLYSDNFSVFSLPKLTKKNLDMGKTITLTVVEKSPGNIEIGGNGVVEKYVEKRCSSVKYVEIGYMLGNRDKILSAYTEKDCNFSEIIESLVSQGDCNALVQCDGYRSVSDPERWLLTKEYLLEKKIILIDRDGVINKKAEQGCYITKWTNFNWIEETLEAMKSLSECGFSFIIITNQACVGRKLATQGQIDLIHSKMFNYLSKKNITVLKIYVCPHHWEDNCDCRKPKPGMLLQASSDFSFRLDKTLYIGDDPRDFEAASRAGTTSVIVGDQGESSKRSKGAHYFPTLLNSLEFIKRRMS